MPRAFSLHPALEQDLAQIHAHIAGDNKDAADRVLKTILQAISLIKALPEASPLYPIDDPMLDGILRRKIVTQFRRRYLVFYTMTEDEVRLLYVHHGALPLEKRIEGESTRL